jgi:2'-5' RNA ligase
MTLFRVTTGKLKIEKTILSKYADETFGSEIIDKIHLKQSNLTPLGPIYSDVFTANARLP